MKYSCPINAFFIVVIVSLAVFAVGIHGKKRSDVSPLQKTGRAITLPANGTCSGLCGMVLDFDSLCFCDSSCIIFDDCCSDYLALCGSSCEGNCIESAGFCQCGPDCITFGDCCPDRKQFCPGSNKPLPRGLNQERCEPGFHMMETKTKLVDIEFFQFFLRPDADIVDATKALKTSSEFLMLNPSQCYVIQPEDVMELIRICVIVRYASSMTLTAYHENGIYTDTKVMRFPQWQRRSCFRPSERLSHAAEINICFQHFPLAGVPFIRLSDVEAKFCHANELLLRHYSI